MVIQSLDLLAEMGMKSALTEKPLIPASIWASVEIVVSPCLKENLKVEESRNSEHRDLLRKVNTEASLIDKVSVVGVVRF